MISKCHFDTGSSIALGIPLHGDAAGIVPHQIVPLHKEHLRILFFRDTTPLFKRGAAHDRCVQNLVVKGVDRLVVNEHVRAARLVFNLFDFSHQTFVVCKERRTRFVQSFDQRLTDENVACHDRIVRRKLHAAIGIHGQTVKRTALKGHHFGTRLFPMRLAPALLDEVAGGPLNPFGFNIGYTSRKQAARFHQLGSHQPFAGLLCQSRSRPDPKANAARSQIRSCPQISRQITHAEIAQKPRQKRGMQSLVVGRLLTRLPADFFREFFQLTPHIAPLAHTTRRNEVTMQLFGELSIACLIGALGLEPIPDIDITQEVT